MRKSDLVLHVETHKNNVITCKFCDHTTTLQKYMKEHMKSHADNKARYGVNCHIVLKMHETNLNAWACKMSYYENGADELALHALSELAKIHTVVLTASKPRTTVDLSGLSMDIFQLIKMCSMKLVYLGNN